MKKTILLLAACLLLTSLFAQPEKNEPSKGFTSWMPAPSAEQALLIGNGTMGAMVFGHPHNETLILNHARLYLPTMLPKQPIDQLSHLQEIRELLLAGKGTEAAKIPVEQSLKEGYPGQIWNDPYIPACDLKIKTTASNIQNYSRSVDFESGVASVVWEQDGTRFERKQFISRADSVLVLQITANNPFDAEFSFERRPIAWNEWDYINKNIKNTRYFASDNHLYYQCEFVNQWDGNIAGYECLGKILAPEGTLTSAGNVVQVKNAKQVLLFVKIETHKKSQGFCTNGIQKILDTRDSDFEHLLAAHKKIHGELFNRVSLNLNGLEKDKMLDSEVMMQQAKQKFSRAFVEKQFYAARYNILSATGITPPNLQGIWGSSNQPPWASDYTHDGNLPVAISSFLCSNMPELMLPFFDYHDARMNYYRDNAKKLYGARGIQVPSHTSSHGWNVHFDPTWCMTFWNGGAAWAAHFYYDYWLYTNDKTFLSERAYPFMKETAWFYEDFLTKGPNGKLVFNPSYSPENNPANNPSQAVINATMDVMLARELLRNAIEAGKILNEDKNQLKKWQWMLSNLPDYETDSTGALREWLWPGYQENHHHRHISHLYGMYDRIDPEIAKNPVLRQGIKKAVEERMKVRRNDGGGIMVFGLVQMAWVAENLGDAALTEEIIQWLSSQYWSNSLATYHDPNGLFNMDLSGGFQTVIIRSLVYSEPNYLWVLPAKPESWENGSISGIQARNQLLVKNLSWSADTTKLTIESPIQQNVQIKIPAACKKVQLANKELKINAKNRTVHVSIIGNKSVTLTLIN